MTSLSAALKVFLRNEQQIDCFNESNEIISKKAVYNECLRDVYDFIEQYDKGEIDPSFIIALQEQQGN